MNLKNLAKHLSLSVTTVSRGLSGYAEVSEKTRKKIRQAAKEMDYVPNSLALSLKKGRTNQIGLVFCHNTPAVEDMYLQSISLCISSALSNYDYNLIIAAAHSREREWENLKQLVQSKTVERIWKECVKITDDAEKPADGLCLLK